MAEIFLGVAADDFTGASDAASFLKEAGVPTMLLNGVPEQLPIFSGEIRAVVIATKTRNLPREQAVESMLSAFDCLKKMGAEQLYFKYCATFDSTREGNIGPVADAVLERYHYASTILCPALPVNGRTVKEGILYVNGVPLSESHMRHHPLTPMTESDVCKLMEMQSKYPAYREKEAPEGAEGPFYIVPDYYEEAHGDRIAEAYGELPFLTGGSGLCGALGRRYMRLHPESDSTQAQGPEALILAGSCSRVTLDQIENFRSKGYPCYTVKPELLLSGEQNAAGIFRWIRSQDSACLVYSSQGPEELKKSQALGQERVATAIEACMGELAALAAESGIERLISAGGETSGAVVKALGYEAFYIGRSVAPGVPVMIPAEAPGIRLVLKSGGFGGPEFFSEALEKTKAAM